MRKTPDISVIVPVYEHWAHMSELFKSMASQTISEASWEMIVVDNGSSRVPAASELPSFVRLIICNVPGSYAARNMGIENSTGDLIVFTDADCIPADTWLEEHWKSYKRKGSACINAGAVEVKKLTPGLPNDFEVYDSLLGIPQERYVIKRGYGVTANLAVSREIFDEVGIFDKAKFSGGDAELCQRATRAGFALSYDSEAVVLHPARSTWSELEVKARRVKGGQIKSGPLNRRVTFFFKSFVYPLVAILRVLRSDLSAFEKRKMLRIVVKLGLVELGEVFRLMAGRVPERR